MALLNTGRYCDHVSQRKPGSKETFCKRRAYHTINSKFGGTLDYCNKHIERGLREYPQPVVIVNELSVTTLHNIKLTESRRSTLRGDV